MVVAHPNDEAVDSARTTTERVFHQMLERIRSGTWPVGSVLPGERKLIDEFGVSRITLREALSTFRALGLIETVHGRGSMVKPIDAEVLACLFPLLLSLDGMGTFEHVLQVRLGLESQTANLAASRRSEADLRELADNEQAMAVAMAADDSQAYTAADMRFHLCIAKASGNPLFTVLLQSLSGYYTYYIHHACAAHQPSRERALDFHQQLQAAIRSQDSSAAERIMVEHLRDSSRRAMEEGKA